MTFVSYAQNFEDVMLWRALSRVDKGFYIDVGAWSPDQDSVTRAFSERGWRGINIEPNPVYFKQLVERRPRDLNLPLAISDRCGTVMMNFIPDSGLSTASDAIASRHAAAGWPVNQQEVPVTTLAQVWQDHVPDAQEVHFLKIDVEGLEEAVLSGNDWTRYRPWIVVVEATLPLSQIESHAAWEGILLRARYEHVYSDGLNRYYVTVERADLKDAFRSPPNVFDDFVANETHVLRVALAEAKQRFQLAEASAIQTRQRERDMKMRMEKEAGALKIQVEAQSRALAELSRQQAAILSSTSWRIVSILRRVAALAPHPARKAARRGAKFAWWAATPWRLPSRLQQRRARHQAQQGFLDLWSDGALVIAAGLPRAAILWPRQAPQAIDDKWAAARFVIDLLRSNPELRARFPLALSKPAESGFSDWLASEESELSAIPAASREHIAALLQEDLGARARQWFLFRTDVRAGMPHGLTPPGQTELFRWFMQHGRQEFGLRSEEVLWLLMQASEDAAMEVVRAYRFTPEWQARHPDALTIFGRDAFADWFGATYRVEQATWLNPENWSMGVSDAMQLREAYAARPAWRAAHPAAFESAEDASAFLEWLRSGDADLDEKPAAWCHALDAPRVVEELLAGGVNVIGHFCSPSGVRVSAESLVAGMHSAGILSSVRDLKTDVLDEPRHVHFDGLETYDITLIHTQPEPFFEQAYARSDLHERSPRTYRIAYWYWEFDSVPASWIERARGVDEVWAATEFVAKGLRERLSIPVRTLFPGVRLGEYQRRSREYFGIEEGTFMFLFNFHMNSVMERKNPFGLIKAFKTAFRPEEPVTLVIKTMFGHHQPVQFQQLMDAAAGARIKVINETYSADEVLSLTDACDAYVSLHRSEGLGLTMAEAMLMGKPVIATNYSGNVDFMNEGNSLLVPYELVPLGRSIPPYDADLLWAEPSIPQAAAMMRRVFDEPEWAREVGARAKASAEATLSIEAAGRRVAHRIAEIRSTHL